VNVHIARPFHLCREVAELQARRARGSGLAHAAFPQGFRPFRHMEFQFAFQIALYATGPHDVPKAFHPSHKCTC
jgi:hypothetical protein